MRTGLLAVAFLALFLFSEHSGGASEKDSEQLKALFDADQAIRSEENVKAGIAPTVQEERDRRIAVFQLLSEGKVRTANDFFMLA